MLGCLLGVLMSYEESFGRFLACTDEKAVFIRYLTQIISTFKPASLLDIGAGDGSLALPLSNLVPHYRAIEASKNFVSRLTGQGINVVEGFFPEVVGTSPSEQFDLVLISHSLPNITATREHFVREAHRMVAKGGHLVVVTFNDEQGHWSDLLDWSSLERFPVNREGLDGLRWFLRTNFCVIQEHMVPTLVTSESINEVMEALAFVYSNAEKDRYERFISAPAVPAYLAEYFGKECTRGVIRFPFEHQWFILYKG